MGTIIFNALSSIFRFFGLNKVTGILIGLGAPLSQFFIWLGKKISIKAIVLPVQYAVMGALFTAKISFLISAVSLILWIYNRFHDLMSLINGINLNNEILSTAWSVLQSIGLVDALYDTLSSFSFIWVSILILLISKFVLHALKLASDELFKIGLLLGQ